MIGCTFQTCASPEESEPASCVNSPTTATVINEAGTRIVTTTSSVDSTALVVGLPSRARMRRWTGMKTTTSTSAHSSTSINGCSISQHR